MGEDSCSGLRLTRAVRRAWGHQRKDLVALGGRSLTVNWAKMF